MANEKTELGSLKLPDTEPYRVVGVGATYLSAAETIGPDGKPTVVFRSLLGLHGEEIHLNKVEARRLTELGAVKAADEPLAYDEMSVAQLEAQAAERGLTVSGSGADGNVLKEDLVNALNTHDLGRDSADSGAVVAADGPGGPSIAGARSQTGRRVSA